MSLQPSPPESLSSQGAELLDAGLPLDAVDVLLQAVAAGEPGAPDLLVRAHLDSGNWHAAAEWLAPLVEQGQVQYAARLGVALAALGDRERAEDALRLAVESGDLAASNDLAILLRDEDRLVEAVQVLTRAAELGDAQAGANLVALHLEADDVLSAIAAAEALVDERRPDTLVALADVRVLQDRPAEADALYRRATELGALRAHTAYGQFLAAVGDVLGAERELLQARFHVEPGSAYALGRFLVEEGRSDEAREPLAIAADAGDEDARRLLDELDGIDPADD